MARQRLGLSNTRERLQALYGATTRSISPTRPAEGAQISLAIPWRLVPQAS